MKCVQVPKRVDTLDLHSSELFLPGKNVFLFFCKIFLKAKTEVCISLETNFNDKL